MGKVESNITEIEQMQGFKDEYKIVECYNTKECSAFELDYMIVITFLEIDLTHYAYFSDIDCMFFVYDNLTK